MNKTTPSTPMKTPESTEQVEHTDITSAFTDPAFLAVIQQHTRNQVLYADEVASITTLELRGAKIRSLAGLEHLVGLEQLVVKETSIEQMTLPELSSLQTLKVLENNTLQTLFLRSFPALQTLKVSWNSSLRTLTLPSLPALQSLDVGGVTTGGNTTLQTLTLPPSLSNLWHLSVGGDVVFQAMEARWAEFAPHLESLQISRLTQTHLTLPSLPALQSLEVDNNTVMSALSLPELPALQMLHMSWNNALNELSLPPSLSNLRHLGVGGDVVFQAVETRWAEIAPHLESLVISWLTQTHLTLPELPMLQTLRVGNNAALRTLNLPSLPELQSLDVSWNAALRTLSLPSLPALQSLVVFLNDALGTLTLPSLPALQTLQVSWNRALRTLSLPSLPALQTLTVGGNDALQTLTFTGALGSVSINTEVYFHDNSLRSLAAFNQIVQHQDATIRSSLGQGDVLHVDEELVQNASVLRNAGVVVQVIENH